MKKVYLSICVLGLVLLSGCSKKEGIVTHITPEFDLIMTDDFNSQDFNCGSQLVRKMAYMYFSYHELIERFSTQKEIDDLQSENAKEIQNDLSKAEKNNYPMFSGSIQFGENIDDGYVCIGFQKNMFDNGKTPKYFALRKVKGSKINSVTGQKLFADSSEVLIVGGKGDYRENIPRYRPSQNYGLAI